MKIMKKGIIVLFVLIISVGFSQNVYNDYWDGIVFFKVNDNSEIVLPEYVFSDNEEKVFQSFPEFISIVNEYEVTELRRPFRTQCPKVQRTYKLSFDAAENVDQLMRSIEQIEYIEYAEMSPIYKQMIVPNDEMVADQYYLENVRAFEAWEIAESNYRVTLAIVDDAVDIDHQDLVPNIWTNPNEVEDGTDTDGNGFIDDIHGWDAANNTNDPRPGGLIPALMFHGTHCAGIAGAATNNNIGIAGVSNNNVSIISVRASAMGFALNNAVEGIDYAVAVGAEIISMSFGGNQAGFIALQNIINAGVANGSIFVAAAGNDGDETITYPAGWPNVIAVGASNQNDNLWVESQRGEFIDLLAPGVNIMSLMPNDGYSAQSGTSMACPLVAGAIALMKSHKPEATNEEIINCLLAGCDNIDDINPDFIGKMGAGRLNIYNSILCLGIPDPHNLTLIVEPEGAGIVTGDGEYFFEADVTITATANQNYRFSAWTLENQQIFSLDEEYSFEMPNNDLVLVANFMDISNIESETINKPEIFPNPFSDVIYIENAEEIKSIKIKSITGSIVLDVNENGISKINTSHIPAGFYIITAEYKTGNTYIQKMIKK